MTGNTCLLLVGKHPTVLVEVNCKGRYVVGSLRGLHGWLFLPAESKRWHLTHPILLLLPAKPHICLLFCQAERLAGRHYARMKQVEWEIMLIKNYSERAKTGIGRWRGRDEVTKVRSGRIIVANDFQITGFSWDRLPSLRRISFHPFTPTQKLKCGRLFGWSLKISLYKNYCFNHF